MGMHPYNDLVQFWQHEKLTVEQVTGQMLQHIGALYEKQRELQREHMHLTQELKALAARLDDTPNVRANANRPKGCKGKEWVVGDSPIPFPPPNRAARVNERVAPGSPPTPLPHLLPVSHPRCPFPHYAGEGAPGRCPPLDLEWERGQGERVVALEWERGQGERVAALGAGARGEGCCPGSGG